MAKTIAVTEQPSTGLQQLKSQPARLGEFLKDVRSEMRKVDLTFARRGAVDHDRRSRDRLHLRRYFWLVDNIIGRAIEALLHNLTKH